MSDPKQISRIKYASNLEGKTNRLIRKENKRKIENKIC